ncbi:MAG TPA: hypothetical protein VGV69_04080 [Solirubrobacterales bacterium]|nr:hypothetical protein [Solirubrobacterales bacterium]
MRILLAADQHDHEAIAALVVAGRHQVVLVHPEDVDHPLELKLRNALPGEEVVTVPLQVVVDGEEPWRPQALLGLRSVRSLIAADATVICALGARPPVVVGASGEMQPVAAAVDTELAVGLLARRLDADRFGAPRELVAELGYARPA